MQRDFLGVWSRERGEMIRAEQAARGLAITPENFVREMDLCPKYVWDIEDEAVTSDGYESAIRWTPMDQACEDFDLMEGARIFWEESYPASAAGYDPSFRAELPKLRWRGDGETVMRVVAG